MNNQFSSKTPCSSFYSNIINESSSFFNWLPLYTLGSNPEEGKRPSLESIVGQKSETQALIHMQSLIRAIRNPSLHSSPLEPILPIPHPSIETAAPTSNSPTTDSLTSDTTPTSLVNRWGSMCYVMWWLGSTKLTIQHKLNNLLFLKGSN